MGGGQPFIYVETYRPGKVITRVPDIIDLPQGVFERSLFVCIDNSLLEDAGGRDAYFVKVGSKKKVSNVYEHTTVNHIVADTSAFALHQCLSMGVGVAKC